MRRKINGVPYGDLIKIKEYAKGIDFIISLVNYDVFDISKRVLCCIHSCIASKEASQEQLWRFRTWDVKLNKVKYRPPHYELLDKFWDKTVKFMDIKNPLEQGLVFF